MTATSYTTSDLAAHGYVVDGDKATRPTKPDVVPAPDDAPPADQRESALQSQFVQWLEYRGYAPRSKKGLVASPRMGWYIHIHQCRKNPYMLDVTLLGLDGRYIEVELKRGPKAKVRQHQTNILEQNAGNAYIGWDMEYLCECVKAWENV